MGLSTLGRRMLGRMTGDQRSLIVRDPAVCHGQAVVAGTTIRARGLLDCLAMGMTEAEHINENPTLPSEGIRVATAPGAELHAYEIPHRAR